MSSRSHRHMVNTLIISLLILYLLAGIRATPFHGDESTTIHKARDWFFLVSGNIQPLLYSPNPADPAEQELRLLNGVTSAYSIGLLLTAMGSPEHEIPKQWLWGADWNYNLANGHIPSTTILFASRLSSALLTAISIALVFGFTRRLHTTAAARLASVLYALTPSVLLNGRRAMYEGATLFAVGLILLAGLSAAYWIKRHNTRRVLISWLLFGIASGFGMASKHILIILILPIAASLLILSRHTLVKAFTYAVMSGIAACIVFFTLNPAWWNAPAQAATDVIRLRRDIAAGQASFYGGYTNVPDRLIALINAPIDIPQYYEAQQGWPEWIAEQIRVYEQSGFSGIVWGIGGVIGLLVRLALLIVLLRARWSNPAYAFIFWFVLIVDLVAIFFLTPLPWQRYYLPLAALWAVAYAIALTTGLQALWRRYAR